MKKRFINSAIILLAALLMTACGTKAEIPKDYDYGDMSEYLKIADYKGIEYTKVTGDVSEEEVKEYIDNMLSGSEETEQIDEGTVAEDSIVNIDYVGSIDGVEFDGGAAQGAELDIANSGYIPGFAEGIVGHEVGETFDLHVTFPEDYGNEDLNGKDAVFKTTINYMIKKKKASYNDEWVQNNSEYKTTDEYNKYVNDMISEGKLSTADDTERSEVFNKILDASELIDYPEKELAERTEQIKKLYMDYAKNANMSFDDFLSSQMGMDAEQFNTMADESAKNTVFQEMVMYSIKNQENLEIKQSEYEEYLNGLLEAAGFTEETFEEQNNMTIAEYANANNMFTSYLYTQVMDKVMEYSVGK